MGLDSLWWLWVVTGAVLAASFASFAGVVAERGWRGAATGRSVCICGRELSATENIPVIGWLRSRGVAPCCGSAIPTRYVWTEALAAIVGIAGGLAGGLAGALVAAILAGVVVGLVSARLAKPQGSR